MLRALDRLSSEQFDVLIVGGGATGCFTARDCAMRGLKVALVEARDFASATSAHNSKLAHGGLRYLRNLHAWPNFSLGWTDRMASNLLLGAA